MLGAPQPLTPGTCIALRLSIVPMCFYQLGANLDIPGKRDPRENVPLGLASGHACLWDIFLVGDGCGRGQPTV